MSQRVFLASLDADLHASLATAGMASSGLYWAKGQDPETPGAPVRVYVDRDIERFGDVQQFKAGRVEVGYLLADCTPAQDGRLEVEGDVYVNGTELSNDGSISRWVVRRG